MPIVGYIYFFITNARIAPTANNIIAIMFNIVNVTMIPKATYIYNLAVYFGVPSDYLLGLIDYY